MLLEMKNITMHFGAVHALDNVNFALQSGEIHGLLGENGAGKSTLMNILGGVFPPEEGKIFIDDKLITELTEKKATQIGIRFIHQELNLINDLSIYENLFLGNEITDYFGILDKSSMINKSSQTLKLIDVYADPTIIVEELDTPLKQQVEIARALLFDSRIIIMDEPTTALTNEEINKLFEVMRKLKDQGVSIIYISHKMPELFEICDRYTVLRNGKFIATGQFSDINESDATELMVGRYIDDNIEKENHAKEVILQAKNLRCEDYFKNLTFSLRKGEVLVFTGLQGDGRSELSEALFGARKLTEGKITLDGKNLNLSSIRKVMHSGVGMIQRNRKERSIIKDMSVLDNLNVAKYICEKNGLFIKRKEQMKVFQESKAFLDIKVDNPENEITFLSGGNQQKVVISRWLALHSDVYIFDNPTQGVDVGAKFEIYNLINNLAKQGISLILFTPEYSEIQKVGDRCIVMYRGEINAVIERNEFSQEKIMYFATGANRKVNDNGTDASKK